MAGLTEPYGDTREVREGRQPSCQAKDNYQTVMEWQNVNERNSQFIKSSSAPRACAPCVVSLYVVIYVVRGTFFGGGLGLTPYIF